MGEITLLVASETRFVRGSDGRVYSTTGVDGYPFWARYLEVFDRVRIAARTDDGPAATPEYAVEGQGVSVAPLPSYCGPLGYARVRQQLGHAMRQAIAQADVLCLRAPGLIAGWAGALRGGRPYGVEVIGDPFEVLAPGSVRSVVRPLARVHMARELRALCRDATAVAYVTEGVLQARYPTRAWSTSYSSIDLGDEAFADDETMALRRARADQGARRLVFVGSLAQLYKGQDVLLDALAQCAERGLALELTMAGDGACRPALERRALERGVASSVCFAGHVPAGAGVRAVLDRADLFALPSRGEGLPRAMIEAMARGLPCLGTRVSGIPELLDDEQLVPPGDASALADALARLFGSPERLAACAVRNRTRAGHYRREVLGARRRAFYERLRAAAGQPDAPMHAARAVR